MLFYFIVSEILLLIDITLLHFWIVSNIHGRAGLTAYRSYFPSGDLRGCATT